MTEATNAHAEPNVFTMAMLGWSPWLPPIAEKDATPAILKALVDPGRVKSDYFMLLARDPDVLEARTLCDKDIFYNTEGGLSRGLREFSATVVSRTNGCIFCASVHARFAARYLQQKDAVQTFLDHGKPDDEPSPEMRLVQDVSEALTTTPAGLEPDHIAALQHAGFDDLMILDLINSASFFAWANRLMLSLGTATW
ncbi:alkylhydroperoxidase domain protein [Gluconacetobacter asukensis]|uniref:Alkylhydroperoxidase domain protein n=1 Tax=Gluconacetobacter asukensis TaxID=1017181 RepID=A0A7W4IZL7_9PROT|nr:alkylhydroperoxidase domain protein [Gluconacetobacter asukensis]MBB2171803.1 alkylhydroperoxidase domain protein [Gluconacetobacter asukensis]